MGGKLHALSRWRSDERGTTAIEFGMVAAPFFLFAFAIMGIGLQFFTINALEHGVESAARKIRTGQLQAGQTINGEPVAYTNQDFKDMICEEAGSYIDCGSKLVIHMSSGAEWADVNTTPCVTAGNLTPSTGNSTDAVTTKTGGASQVVLVTACYEWDLGGMMWQTFWNMLVTGAWGDGAAKTADKVIIQGVSTFRTEPYN
jgi:Flp pilus assembly protein TadG